MDKYLYKPLTAISRGQSARYSYNGFGNSLSQNGINYKLDTSISLSAGLNSGLTQVLADGTNTCPTVLIELPK